MHICLGDIVAQCSDWKERYSPTIQGLDWGRNKVFFRSSHSGRSVPPSLSPAVTDGFHTRNNCPGLEAGVSTAYSTDFS